MNEDQTTYDNNYFYNTIIFTIRHDDDDDDDRSVRRRIWRRLNFPRRNPARDYVGIYSTPGEGIYSTPGEGLRGHLLQRHLARYTRSRAVLLHRSLLYFYLLLFLLALFFINDLGGGLPLYYLHSKQPRAPLAAYSCELSSYTLFSA